MSNIRKYIDLNCSGNVLAYIHISSPFGNLKFLVDSGASHSCLDPKYIFPEYRTKIPPLAVKSILGEHTVNEEIVLPAFNEFNVENIDIKFLIYKFHDYFDGLLGLNALKSLKGIIDFDNDSLVIGKTKIKLYYKPTITSNKTLILSQSFEILKLPVDKQNGDIFIHNLYIDDIFLIPEGVYSVNEWIILAPVYNISPNEAEFFISQPIKVNTPSQIIEFNFQQIKSQSNSFSTNIQNLIRTDHLNEEEKFHIIRLCEKFEDIFFKNGDKLSFTNEVKHKILTNDDIPIYSKSYRYPYIYKDEIARQIDQYLEQGIIKPSFSPWSSPVWIVPKKIDASGKQKYRLVIDYRKLNSKTIDDRYPLPNINELLDKLGRSQYFSVLDLASGFHQIEIDPKDGPKTAFTVDNGHYEFTRMTFGLKNGPATFQRVMDNILREFIGKTCLVYMDDIIVFSTSLQEHIVNLSKIFEKLRTTNLKVQIDKCEFLRQEITYLGHLITKDGIKPDSKKISAILDYPLPKTQTEIKGFLGLLGYYRKFIKDFAKLTKPMTKCLKKGSHVEHNDEFLQCFEICKHLLIQDPILKYPDFSKDFVLTTDASNIALGAVLSQVYDGQEHPICYASRTLNDTENKYSPIEKELLAIMWAVKYFRPYLYGRKFKIITDHAPLQWLNSIKEPNAKLFRWKLKLQEYNFDVIHKPGKLNTNADALSRIKIDLNANETNDNNNENDSMVTNHSADEDDTGYIRISEKPLNYFSNQLRILENKNTPFKKFEIYFKTKKVLTFNISENIQDRILDIVENHLNMNTLYALYIPSNNIFRIFQNVYLEKFTENYKFVRTMKEVKNVFDPDEQDQLIRTYHSSNGHRGINESLLHLQRENYFPNMKEKINKVINSCTNCKLNKYDRNPPKQVFELTETPEKPLEICHSDIFYYNKNNPYLTIIDKFSRFAQVFSLNSRNTIHIKQALVNYITGYSKPIKLVIDQEGGFISTELMNFCSEMQIQLHITSSKSSNSNSPIERFHSTLLELLRIINAEDKYKDYSIVNKMKLATFFYNNSIHSVTKYTPYELFFGREYDAKLEPDLKKLSEYQNNLYKKIAPTLAAKKTRLTEKLNKNREKPIEYPINHKAYVSKNIRTKLDPRFREVKIRENNKVTVLENTGRKLHKNKLRRISKFQDELADNFDDNNSDNHSESSNTGSNEQSRPSGTQNK